MYSNVIFTTKVFEHKLYFFCNDHQTISTSNASNEGTLLDIVAGVVLDDDVNSPFESLFYKDYNDT